MSKTVTDELILNLDYSMFNLAKKGFGAKTPCPSCKLPCAQQLLTSFLCANHKCANYDPEYFAESLKTHVKNTIINPPNGTILVDKIRVVSHDNYKFEIFVPFTRQPSESDANN